MKPQRLSRRWSDIECLCGLPSRKFTCVNNAGAFILGAILFAAFYGVLSRFHNGENPWVEMFFHGGAQNRSTIPYYTVFLGMWSLAIVFIKRLKLRTQAKVLALKILPDDPNFVLTCATAREIIDRINDQVINPKDFVLLDRVLRALLNLKNLGNVSAVAECLNTQAQNDDDTLHSSYTLLKGFLWAIPVLGFIGTVLGLSEAVGGFGKVVQNGCSDPTQLIASLGNVTGGLSIAFETTLIALLIVLVVQLLMTLVVGKEEQFLDECSDYCHRNIISKIKSLDLIEEEA